MAQQSWPQELQKIPFNPLRSLVFLIPFLYVFKRITSSKTNLPPSPPKIPIIGNLHQLGTLPHRSLKALSNKCGPLMFMYLGNVPTLVVSFADMAREIMKTYDIISQTGPKLQLLISYFTDAKTLPSHPMVSIGNKQENLCPRTFEPQKCAVF